MGGYRNCHLFIIALLADKFGEFIACQGGPLLLCPVSQFRQNSLLSAVLEISHSVKVTQKV